MGCGQVRNFFGQVRNFRVLDPFSLSLVYWVFICFLNFYLFLIFTILFSIFMYSTVHISRGFLSIF
jgi:hypothetical protein